MSENEEDPTPEYILPLFFTTKTQEIFSCKVDEEVTEDKPFKLIAKETILQDFRNRAAISDFHPAKKIIEDYPTEELLVVYDACFKYGQNFYLVTADEEKQALLQSTKSPDDEEIAGNVSSEELEAEVPRIGLRTPKPWLSLESDLEVFDEMVTESHEKVRLTFTRERQHFGRPVFFEDRNEDELKDVTVDCFSFQDASYNISKFEQDVAIQYTADVRDEEAQTEWPCPKNASTQYESRTNTLERNAWILNSEEMMDFMSEVTPRFELALQQNEALDVFVNDYLNLGEEESAFGTKSDNHLKEYQSFTDLQFSKNKMISDIQWHPHIKGMIAVSCIEQLSFYDRVEQSAAALMRPSLILIWSFADPIHPLLLLEAPDDIMCFKFNPSDPNIICGGCINGQIVLWDIKEYSELLQNHRTQGQGSNTRQHSSNVPSFLITTTTELSPMVRYAAVSSIENSHRMAITDIQWIPGHIEIGRMGVVLESKSEYCCQLITCSSDGYLLFWDIKSNKSSSLKTEPSVSSIDGQVTTFQHLDLSWKPLLKVNVFRMRGTGEFSPVKFSIDETQSAVKQTDQPLPVLEDDEEEYQFSGISYKKKDEGRQLDDVKTKFHVVTEDGELVYLDWKPMKDIDTGKIASPRPDYSLDAHEGTINTLQKSPFLNDIMLTVGGWTFAIWKDGVTYGPLFQSYSHECKLTCGHWSPSRPSVFFIGKADGNIDVWDLLDKSHEPFLRQNVSPAPISTVFANQVTNKQQLLAAGDDVGTLHVMEVPWNIRHPSTNEISIFENYLEREANRIRYLENDRDKTTLFDIKQTEYGAQKELLSDEEWESRAKMQYEEYLEMEKRLLYEIGLAGEGSE